MHSQVFSILGQKFTWEQQGEGERENKYGKMLMISESSEGFIELHCTILTTVPCLKFKKFFSKVLKTELCCR